MNTISVHACFANFALQLVRTVQLRLLPTLNMQYSTVQSW